MMKNRFFMLVRLIVDPLLVRREELIAQTYSTERDQVLSAQPVDGEKQL
jgi:hypothetical protein